MRISQARLRVLLFAGLLLLLGAGVVLFIRWPQRSRLNVVVVVVDTLRQDHLAGFGYIRDTAPLLGELARNGVTMDGISPSSWTKPATASILTGLHPVTHQAIDRQDELPEKAVTLAEILRDEGYRTLAASANGWVSPTFGFDQGFEEFLLREGANLRARELNRVLLPRVHTLREPFFLYVHYIDPHVPYAPATDWRGEPLPDSHTSVTLGELAATQVKARPAELLQRAIDLYDGEIRGADGGIAELVSALRGRGVFDRTLLVVTSDHGEEFEDHGRMSHGQTLYEEMLRVPLIFHGPGLSRGARLSRASLIDIAPTLLDLLGVRRWLRFRGDGVSVAGALRSGRMAQSRRGFLGHLDFVDGISLSYTSGEHKMVLAKRPYAKEIFDLASDPRERRNLLGSTAGDRSLREVGSAAAKTFNEYSRRALARSAASLDPDLAARLAALGYTSSGPASAPRYIPRRIVVPDSLRDGRLGWEPVREPPTCANLVDRMSETLLLAGWHAQEKAGRWTAPMATLSLGVPAGRQVRLELRGVNHRPDPAPLRVNIAEKVIFDRVIPTGPFQVEESVARAELDSPALLRLTTKPFVPSLHGSPDPRTLGLFFESICLR